MSPCPRTALLPDHGLRRSPSCSPIARARLRHVKHARQPHHAAPQLPHQLHHEPAHYRMRPRRLLAPADLRRLPSSISPLALHHLAPAVRRISSAARPTAATTVTVTATANYHSPPGGAGAADIKHDAQCGARQRQLHCATTVHRDVQRSGPRMPHIPRLPLPAHQVFGERQLWRWVYRQRGRRGEGRRCAWRPTRSVGKRVLQYQLEWEFSRPLRAFPGRAGGIHIGRGRIPAGERIGLTELRTLPWSSIGYAG
jgi:hypothetical protein